MHFLRGLFLFKIPSFTTNCFVSQHTVRQRCIPTAKYVRKREWQDNPHFGIHFSAHGYGLERNCMHQIQTHTNTHETYFIDQHEMDLSRAYTGTGVYRHKICNVHSIDGLYTEAKISFPPPLPFYPSNATKGTTRKIGNQRNKTVVTVKYFSYLRLFFFAPKSSLLANTQPTKYVKKWQQQQQQEQKKKKKKANWNETRKKKKKMRRSKRKMKGPTKGSKEKTRGKYIYKKKRGEGERKRKRNPQKRTFARLNSLLLSRQKRRKENAIRKCHHRD